MYTKASEPGGKIINNLENKEVQLESVYTSLSCGVCGNVMGN